MEKILITGVSGFIGQYLTKGLHKDYEIWGLYENPDSMRKNPEIPPERSVIADLKDKSSLEVAVVDIQPDYVIHLAAKSEVALSFKNYYEVSQVNYLGTVALAEANRKFNPNLKLFLMASTMETYGHQPHEPFTEETAQHPMAPYAVAKVACERYLEYMDYAYGFPYVALRQTNAYGRTDNDFFVVERIITQMLEGQICNLGDPDPFRNFLFISDLVDLYKILLSDHDKVKGQAYVTGPNNAIQIRDLATAIADKLDWSGQINWHTVDSRPGEIYYLNSDPKKAKEIFGWEPKVTLSEGLDKTISIWKDKRCGC